MEIIPADGYDALMLEETQKTFVMTPEGMRRALMREDTFGFYAVENGVQYGFALLRRLGPAKYFLWEYVIDHSYQGQGRGRAFLSALIALLRETYGANTLWTTYIWGNDAARRLYERLGFVETDVVDEDGIHQSLSAPFLNGLRFYKTMLFILRVRRRGTHIKKTLRIIRLYS